MSSTPTATILAVVLGLAAPLAVTACSDEFPELAEDAGPAEDGAVAGAAWEATYTANPSHPHPGDVMTLTFLITKDGSPAEGLAPTAHYTESGGSASGEIALSAGTAPGTYVGRHAFRTAGTYLLEVELDDGGQTVRIEAPPFVLEGH